MSEERGVEQGCVYRTRKGDDARSPVAEGMPNFYWHTATEGMPKVKLDRGINGGPTVDDGGGDVRVPLILLRSSLWKAGTEETPWADSYDAERSLLRYNGDNRIMTGTMRPKADDPSTVVGNRRLIDAYWAHASDDRWDRASGGPVLLFTGVRLPERDKGNVRFDGMGVVSGVSYELQRDSETGLSFRNCVFEIVLLDLSPESRRLDWRWISARRTPGLPTPEADRHAPDAWRVWTREGHDALDRLRLRNPPVTPLASA